MHKQFAVIPHRKKNNQNATTPHKKTDIQETHKKHYVFENRYFQTLLRLI